MSINLRQLRNFWKIFDNCLVNKLLGRFFDTYRLQNSAEKLLIEWSVVNGLWHLEIRIAWLCSDLIFSVADDQAILSAG